MYGNDIINFISQKVAEKYKFVNFITRTMQIITKNKTLKIVNNRNTNLIGKL